MKDILLHLVVLEDSQQVWYRLWNMSRYAWIVFRNQLATFDCPRTTSLLNCLYREHAAMHWTHKSDPIAKEIVGWPPAYHLPYCFTAISNHRQHHATAHLPLTSCNYILPIFWADFCFMWSHCYDPYDSTPQKTAMLVTAFIDWVLFGVQLCSGLLIGAMLP